MLQTAAKPLSDKDAYLASCIQVLTGSILLALSAQVSLPLPFTPVPLSLQTFALFIMAMTLGSKKASLAVILYLVQGSVGLPVFAGGTVNPMWLIGPKAGYLIGFVLAAYLIGKLAEANRERSLFETALILLMGELTILGCGSAWLSLFVGASNAINAGILPFIAGDFVKIVAAALSFRPLTRALQKFK